MEPSGRNQWQPAANGETVKSDGKEGVDGSSPSEGFEFLAAQRVGVFSAVATARC